MSGLVPVASGDPNARLLLSAPIAARSYPLIARALALAATHAIYVGHPSLPCGCGSTEPHRHEEFPEYEDALRATPRGEHVIAIFELKHLFLGPEPRPVLAPGDICFCVRTAAEYCAIVGPAAKFAEVMRPHHIARHAPQVTRCIGSIVAKKAGS